MTATPLPTTPNASRREDLAHSPVAPSAQGKLAVAITLAVGLIAAGLGLFWTGFTDLCWLAYNDPESSHILLIPPLLVYLAAQRREAIAQAFASAGSGWLGLVPLAVGVFAWEWGYREDMRIGGHLAVVFWVVGSLVVAFGHRAAIAVGWPILGLLLLAVPIPYSIRIGFAVPAQQITAAIAEQALLLTNLPVIRTGSVLHVGDTQVGIAEACNGMRMLFAVGLICYAYAVATPMRAWARVALLVISPLIALACNVVRVVMATWVYSSVSEEAGGLFHDLSGWGTAVLAFVVVWTFGNFGRWLGLPIYRDAVEAPGGRSSVAGKHRTKSAFARAQTLIAVLGGGVMAATSLGLSNAHLSPRDAGDYHQSIRAAVEAFPYKLGAHGEWVGTDVPLPAAAIELLSPNALFAREFRHLATGDRFTFVFVHCYDARDMLGHYPPVCYPGNGWELLATPSGTSQAANVAAFDFRQTMDHRTWHLRVLQQFLTPDGLPAEAMQEVRRYAGNHETRHFGMAQWQIVLRPDASEAPEVLESEALAVVGPGLERLRRSLERLGSPTRESVDLEAAAEEHLSEAGR